jgi:hypothetical protein
MMTRKSALHKLHMSKTVQKMRQKMSDIPVKYTSIPQSELDAMSEILRDSERGRNFSIY